jgi:predicted phosphohydrolase
MFVIISVATSFPFPSSIGIGPTYTWEQSVEKMLKSYANQIMKQNTMFKQTSVAMPGISQWQSTHYKLRFHIVLPLVNSCNLHSELQNKRYQEYRD